MEDIPPDYLADRLDNEDFDIWLAAQDNSDALPAYSEDIPVAPSPTHENTATKGDARTELLDSFVYSGISLKPGSAVELDDGTFMKITEILRHRRSAEVFLRGQMLLRLDHDELQLGERINELCWVAKNSEPSDIQSYLDFEVAISKVIKVRHLCMTNRLWPDRSLEEDPAWIELRQNATPAEWKMYEAQAKEEGGLVCRTKRVRLYRYQKLCEEGFLALSDEECDQDGDSSLPGEYLRRGWRGFTTRGGSSDHWLRGEKDFLRQEEICDAGKTCYKELESATLKWPVMNAMERPCVGELVTEEDVAEKMDIQRDVDQIPRKIPESRRGQRYLVGDAFCGGGGMSRGAVTAGLRVAWGFDFDIDACETFIANNFGTTVYHLWADRFAHLPMIYCLRVDILHLSPSCKYWSPMHTREGKEDEQNIATLFALQDLLVRCQPRIVTMEQTAGLLTQNKHKPFFNAVIRWFTEHGFQVHWRILQCLDYGVPQSRPRLFVIAACPGEPLPPFPEPTHHKTGENGLQPWTTINSALSQVPDDWPDHDPDVGSKREPRYSGETHAKCLCTVGNLLHPNGKRNLTNRELACLHTFPLSHKFADLSASAIRKQIGNSVPPLVARLFFETIKQTLMRTDGLID